MEEETLYNEYGKLKNYIYICILILHALSSLIVNNHTHNKTHLFIMYTLIYYYHT